MIMSWLSNWILLQAFFAFCQCDGTSTNYQPYPYAQANQSEFQQPSWQWYPDGYQHWYSSYVNKHPHHQNTIQNRQQAASRQAFLGLPLGVIASVAGVRTLLKGIGMCEV